MASKRLTSLKAIKLRCLDCSAYSKGEVRKCPVTNCPLHQFRFGKRTKKPQVSYVKNQKNNEGKEDG
jgi:hypothetical protein